MRQISQLAIFDVDGTIATHGEVPSSVIKGMHHLQNRGYITTISTGRGYVRAKETLGADLFDSLISDEALIILEHGTKIVTKTGDVVFGAYFSPAEIEHIVDFTRANIGLVRLVWFNPIDLNRKVQVWCFDASELDAEIGKRGHYADVFTGPLGELREKLLAEQVSNVTVKLKDYVKVQNLKLSFTRTETNVIFQDGNMEFIRGNINKAIAIQYLLREYGFELDKLLVAGNAINDVEMLDVDAKTRILVGKGEESDTVISYLENPTQVVRVKSPKDLGRFLSKL